MLPDTCHSISNSLRWICSLKIHSATRRRSVRRKPPGEQWSRRETIEAQGTKWNFDVEMDSGIPGPTLEPRRDEGMPTATGPMDFSTVHPPAPPPERHAFEMQVHSNSGGGDVAAKTVMVICDPSYMNPAKTKVIGKVSITQTLTKRLFQSC